MPATSGPWAHGVKIPPTMDPGAMDPGAIDPAAIDLTQTRVPLRT
ncbi:MAG: hypothetical protein ACOX5I_06775 [Gleimia sp.]